MRSFQIIRPRRALGILTLTFSTLLGACDDDPAGHGELDEDGLRGVVARQKTGEGVPGVTMAARSNGVAVAAAVTGDDGAFRFGTLPDGSYEVVPVGLDLAGLDARFDVMEPPRDTALLSDGAAPALVFAVVGLVPARITGMVSCGGTPDPVARLRVVGGPSTDQTVEVDALGRYAALDLNSGTYVVIPVTGNCTVSPAYHVATVRPGELVRADFEG